MSPTEPPKEMTAGDTATWGKALDDYTPAGGWVLKYYFRSASGGHDVTGTPDGAGWQMSLTLLAAESGRMNWEAWVEKGSEHHFVGRGSMKVTASLRYTAANEGVDVRTQAEKDLDAVRAALVPATAAGVQEYEIGGVGTNRRVRYFSKTELLQLENALAQRVNRERRRAARERGAGFFKNVY